ncbi:hypothetical protein HN385_00055 [archaeon]|jgi:hypothetical protein|nr:hypothetical protein [archaeon]MBT3450850.1 hypothetical protein [archaeon]MBT6869019.1 hypothetical protein [archaeon]MBT7193607.1 hypothetical protein [archaeon]MBT7380140.1 hypothetical protein [archaeon]
MFGSNGRIKKILIRALKEAEDLKGSKNGVKCKVNKGGAEALYNLVYDLNKVIAAEEAIEKAVKEMEHSIK